MGRQPRVEGMGEALIPAINKLQDVFNQASVNLQLDLPQVVVIGSQSSGKSSVLEALVGRDFLPRGPDICTRRPLVLQLVKTSPSEGGPEGTEWGEFLHCPGRRFFDFKEIRREIEAETDRVAGSSKAISDKPIRLKICSPEVLTLTLVDLPGITRIPVGDQPSDIEAQVRAMIASYVRHPTCLILAVSAANADLSNSDALDVARAADPGGVRTIGVLTKVDLMDRGTDAAAALRNEVVPLKLGYIAVVNRSQHDVQSGTPISRARSAESGFFRGQAAYAGLLDRCGTAALGLRINAILVHHIHALMPQLKQQLEAALAERVRELTSLGDALTEGDSPAAQQGLLLKVLQGYSERFASMLDGRSEDLPTSELAGGARIRHVFEKTLRQELEALDPLSDLSDEDIRTAVANSGGVKGTLMIPTAPFEILARAAIRRLLPAALRCNHVVHEELLRIAAASQGPEVARFPALQRRLDGAVTELIALGAGPSERMIRNLMECELAHINTSHPDFVGGSQAVALVMQRRRAVGPRSHPLGSAPADWDAPRGRGPADGGAAAQGGGVEQPDAGRRVFGLLGPREPRPAAAKDGADDAPRSAGFGAVLRNHNGGHTPGGTPGTAPHDERAEASPAPARALETEGDCAVEVTRILVSSYFEIVRGSFADSVPKAIMCFLVNKSVKELHHHLIASLYREELLPGLLAERDDVVGRRQQCSAAVAALREAVRILERVPRELQKTMSVSQSISMTSGSLSAAAKPRRPASSAATRMVRGGGIEDAPLVAMQARAAASRR
ncbi:unnamed protein product [Pedinophyceae sp. YPF-701]|nr:unnamed protein product [Pedinophyceae sp. YPF-701]